MLKLTLILIAFGCLCNCSSHYDHYVLSFEIPGTVCQVKDCQKEFLGDLQPDSINLHGLWPNIGDAEGPFECGPNIYDEKQVSADVLKRMNENFNGLYNSSFWFRYHEYGKHGSCFNYNTKSSKKLFLSDEYKPDVFFLILFKIIVYYERLYCM